MTGQGRPVIVLLLCVMTNIKNADVSFFLLSAKERVWTCVRDMLQ